MTAEEEPSQPLVSELSLAIKCLSEPIAGAIRMPDGSERPFEGYIDLVTQLELARIGRWPDPGRGRAEIGSTSGDAPGR